jgi:formylglycine-generating enzyme required for sulfatase activity
MHGNVWEWCLDDWHDNYNGAPNNGLAWLDNYNRMIINLRETLDSLVEKNSGNQNNKLLRGGQSIRVPAVLRFGSAAVRAFASTILGFGLWSLYRVK